MSGATIIIINYFYLKELYIYIYIIRKINYLN